MGCVSSKSFRPNPSWVSSHVSANQTVEDDGEYIPTGAWTPIPYEELNPEIYKGSFLFIGSRYKHCKITNPPAESDEPFAFSSHVDVMACADTNSWMQEEEGRRLLVHDSSGKYPCRRNASSRHDVEVIDAWLLMKDLEGSAKEASYSLHSQNCGKLRTPDKHIPFNKWQGSISEPVGSPVWKKYYMQEDELVGMGFPLDQNVQTPPMVSPFDVSPRRVHTPPPNHPFSGSPRSTQLSFSGSPFSRSREASSRGFHIDLEDGRSFPSVELLDASTMGLKFLLSSADSSFRRPPVIQSEGSHPASRQSLDENTRSLRYVCASFDRKSGNMCVLLDDTKSPCRSPNMTRHGSKKSSTESVFESGSRSLFDPSLLAAFERAVTTTREAVSYDEWLQSSTDGSMVLSSSSVNTQTSCDTTSDAESLPLWQNRGKSSLTVVPDNKAEVWPKRDLASYDMRCPPRGEGKIVLYFTSLRGIRRTYEDCWDIRLILRGLGARVDERDVWMHSTFKNELMDVLHGTPKGMSLQVPQLFINGRYIGGAEEVKQLHDEGILACLMNGLTSGVIHNVCDGCGDARFLPCFTCSGSLKVLSEDNEFLRCRDCNENGLIMCPMCII